MPKWWIEQLVPRNQYDNFFTFCLVLGVVGLIVSGFFAYKLRSKLFRVLWASAFFVTLFLTITLTYAYLIEPNWLIVKTYPVSTPQLTSGEKLKVVVIADFQYKTVASPSYVGHVVDVVNSLEPDLVFLVGDLIESRTEELPYYVPLKDMQSKLGNFAILGNHDYAFPSGNPNHMEVGAEVAEALEDVGFTVLRNETLSVEFKDKKLAIGGIDDTWFKVADPQKVVTAIQAQNADLNLILHHEPDALQGFTGLQNTYSFAGHCHGSQVTLGKVLNPLFRLPIFPPYCTILNGESKGWAPGTEPSTFVTPGVGTANIRVRLLSRPEVSVIEFTGQ